MSPSLSKSVTLAGVLVFLFKRVGEPPEPPGLDPPGLDPPGPDPLGPPGPLVPPVPFNSREGGTSPSTSFNSREGGASSSPPVNSSEGGASPSVPPNGSGIDGGASSAKTVTLLNAKVITSIEIVANSLKRNFVFMFLFLLISL